MRNLPKWLEEKIVSRYPKSNEVLISFADWIASEIMALMDTIEDWTDPVEKFDPIKWTEYEMNYWKEAIRIARGNESKIAELTGQSKYMVRRRIRNLGLYDYAGDLRRKTEVERRRK